MKKEPLFEKLKEFGIHTKEQFFSEAFSRNIGLLSEADQEKLANATIAIPGMGGVGGIHLITMVRTGVGRFHIADFDTFEPANLNRQYGARIPDFGRRKLEVMKAEALHINPYLEFREFSEGVVTSNIDDFLDGVDVVLDSLDFFEFDTRRLLFNRAREKGVYVITAAPLGFSSAMLVFSPHEGMSFDEYFNIVDGMTPEEQYLSYAIGLAPKGTHIKYMDFSRVDFQSKGGPSSNIACQLCAGMAANEAVRIILKRGSIKPVPHYFQFDPYVQKYRRGKLILGNRNPIQRFKMKVVKSMLDRNKRIRSSAEPERPLVNLSSTDLSDDVIHYIIRAGIQAPSGDNAQPWKFYHNGNRISLYLDRDADCSFFNVNQIASIISCGAVLENMKIASTAFGYEAKIRHRISQGSDRHLACMELIKGNENLDPLINYIWERHTNRKFYEKRHLADSALQSMQDVVSDFPGVHLHLVTRQKDIKKLAKIVYRADRIRTEHRPLHEHLQEMIRYNNDEAMKKGDGFFLKNLEAGFVGEIFLRASRPWPVMNLINKVGIGRMVALHSYQGILNSSGAALLTVDGISESDFIRGGQALQRLWLLMAQRQIRMQPMTAITLFRLRWYLEGEQCFSIKHQKILRDIWPDYEAQFTQDKPLEQGHVMLFRFGYAKEIKYRTYRREMESFLK